MTFARIGFSFALAFAAFQITSANVTPARAAVVNLWHTAGNGSITIDNFSVPDAGVIARTANSAGPGGLNPFNFMQIFAAVYSDIPGCALPGCGAYSGLDYGDVYIQPTGAQGITFLGFDLGSWGGVSRTSNVEIWNGDYTQLFSSFALTAATTHASYATNLFSQNGFHIRFESLGTNIGVNNFEFEVGGSAPPSGTPVPGALPLFASILGAGGIVAWRRRRK